MVYRSQISKKLNQSSRDVERRLWHGTEEERVESIAELNFNRGYAGERRKNGKYFWIYIFDKCKLCILYAYLLSVQSRT